MTNASSPQSRLDLAYRLLVSRDPAPKEQTILLSALDRLKSQFAADKPAAEKFMACGESKRDTRIDAVEQAAYTGVCLEIMNLDETLNKE
jgi:hypothetical protein